MSHLDIVKAFAQDDEEVLDIEQTLYDLYLGDQLVGTVLLSYTEEWFEIEDPEEAVAQLEDVTNPSKLIPLLTGKIYKTREIEELGKVHYDLSTFQVILQLNSSLLKSKSLDSVALLPAPENKFSLYQELRGALSGEISGDNNSAISGRSLGAIGANWLNADNTLIMSDDNSLEVNQLSANSIYKSTHIEGGFLQTQGQFLASSLNIVGIGLSTAQDIVVDGDRQRGSKLEVFVPARSRVEFFRGDRLLTSQILNFGLQEIDTSNFPQGSYVVNVIIHMDDGEERRESHFFTKSGLLALRGRPFMLLRGGLYREDLTVTEYPVYEGKIVWRALDSVQLDISTYGTDEETIGAVEGTGLWRNFTYSIGVLSSAQNDVAYTSNASLEFYGFDVNGRILSTSSGFENVESSLNVPETNDSLPPVLLGAERKDISMSAGRQLGLLSFRYFYNSVVSDTEDSKRQGIRTALDILQDTNHSLRLTASYFNTDQGRESEILLTYSLRLSEDTLYTEIASNENRDSTQQRLKSGWYHDSKQNKNTGRIAEWSGELIKNEEKTAGGDKEAKTSLENELGIEDTSKYVRAAASLRDKRFGEANQTSYGLEANSSVTFAEGSEHQLSAPIQSEAMVIFSVESDTTNAEVELLINDNVYKTAKSGQKILVGLSPFQKYTFAIRPTEKADLVRYDDTVYTTVVFPGNVLAYTFKVEKIFIGLGTALNTDGNPIPWAKVKGIKGYAVTEEDGSFQLEITGKETITLVKDGKVCTLDLPHLTTSEEVVDYGNVTCR